MNIYNIYLKSLNPNLCLKMILNYQIQKNNINTNVNNLNNTENVIKEKNKIEPKDISNSNIQITLSEILNKATKQDRLL